MLLTGLGYDMCTMCHDDATNESRAGPPAALLRVHKVPLLVQELGAKGPRKVVSQIVAGACLRRDTWPIRCLWNFS